MDQHPLSPDLEDRFRRDVEECGLTILWPRVRALALPSHAVELVTDIALGLLGTSRLGGLPDLPAGRGWPERDGRLLTFIGQVNLAEVPSLPVPLPERGMMYFFLGVDEPASNIVHEVLFWDGPDGQLSRQEEPDESAFLNEDCTVFWPAGVRFVPAVSLPSFFRDSSLDEFSDQLEELRQRQAALLSPRTASQLLGHPLAIAGDPLAEAYVAAHGHPDIIYRMHWKVEDAERDLAAALAEGDAQRFEYLRRQRDSLAWFHRSREHHRREIGHWQLLLEVASHREGGMCWWDAGRLQFLIDSRDLAARYFSRTYACIQTS
jgi:hypothetical protein